MVVPASDSLRPAFSVDGGWRRFYVDNGSGSPIILFLHGIPTHHVLWYETARFVDSRFRVVLPDLVGFGKSDLPANADLSPAGQAESLIGFLDDREVNEFSIVAHDFGALVACELLVRLPERVRSLVFTNTSIDPGDWSGGWLNPLQVLKPPVIGEVALWLAQKWMLRRAFRHYLADQSTVDGDGIDRYWEPFDHHFRRTLLQIVRSKRFNSDQGASWARALNRFSGDVTVVWGTLDPTFKTDRADCIIAACKTSELILLQSSNHFVPLDRPRTLARIVNKQIAAL